MSRDKAMNLRDLEQQKRQLEQDLASIKAEGEYLVDCWIERTASGGNSTGVATQPGRYATLRSRSQTFSNGRKSMYLRQNQVARYEASIERGRKVKEVERQLQKVIRSIDKLHATAARLGIAG